MKFSGFGLYALGFYAGIAVLAACGGGDQAPLAPSGPFRSNSQSRLGLLPEGLVNTAVSGASQTGVVAMHPDHGRSWMTPGAAAKDLLYISNQDANDVLVFSYPEDKLVGTLSGLYAPEGLCVDKKGDVWVVNDAGTDSGEDIVEYKHGGKTQIGKLEIGNGLAISCSIDKTTGDLAVNDLVTVSDAGGYVSIFAKAKGTPKTYTPPNMSNPYFCDYDDKGNLYVDGTQNGLSTQFILAERPKGQSFKDITLKGGTINFPGNIVWDGKYLLIGDQEYKGEFTSGIYQTTGAGGKIVGSIPLTGSGEILGYWIEGNTIIGPDYENSGVNNVYFYKYPAGGKPIKTLKGFEAPAFAAISVAQ
jgi:hypothetical protein